MVYVGVLESLNVWPPYQVQNLFVNTVLLEVDLSSFAIVS